MTRKRFISFIAFVLSAFAMSAQGPCVSYLGANHVMVRINAISRYLLMPVEEKAPVAHVSLLLSGNRDQQLNVRLAQGKVDYYVPLDLKKYEGKTIVLNIITDNDRTNVRDQREDICWKLIACADTFSTANTEKWRPLCHHTPLYGWMNDPNGMVYLNGEYHLFYQYNPYGSQWENMTWGHSVSKDLTHWTHLPNAITPDALGAIFSGSCVIDKDNTAGFGNDAMVAIYTSAGDNQTQSLAYSNDGGRTFTKYEGNPVLTSDVPDFRDPKVFWNPDINRWNMILAAGQEMRIYSSANLREWTLESSFGKQYGAHGGVWECPDLMQLPVEGKPYRKWVLFCNINPGGPFGGSATQYFVGSFDGHRFVCDSQPSVTKWADYGKDHYAAVTFSGAPSNRHILMAWMSNWQYGGTVPTRQYRSANSLPRDLSLYEQDGETCLKVVPSDEMVTLRGAAILGIRNAGVGPKGKTARLAANSGAYEMVADFVPAQGGTLEFTLSNAAGERLSMTYDTNKGTFAMDRTKSGNTTFSADFPAVTVAPVKCSNAMRLRVFVDRSSIEAFDGNGRFAMTNLVFPSQPYSMITYAGKGKSRITSLTVYNLK